jgi:hypothetical protein
MQGNAGIFWLTLAHRGPISDDTGVARWFAEPPRRLRLDSLNRLRLVTGLSGRHESVGREPCHPRDIMATFSGKTLKPVETLYPGETLYPVVLQIPAFPPA